MHKSSTCLSHNKEQVRIKRQGQGGVYIVGVLRTNTHGAQEVVVSRCVHVFLFCQTSWLKVRRTLFLVVTEYTEKYEGIGVAQW